jgi:hypothetical protein
MILLADGKKSSKKPTYPVPFGKGVGGGGNVPTAKRPQLLK